MPILEVKNLVIKAKSNKILKKQNKYILKGLNMQFKSGELNAIIAPNGTGKTVFLNSLFGYSHDDFEISGEILYNNVERDIENWFDEVSFIEEANCSFGSQTLQQIIDFALEIKKSKIHIDHKDYDDVADIITSLELTNFYNTPFNHLSTGIKKKVLLARDLVMGKKVIILDEPLANLDAHISKKFIRFLKKKAVKENLIVIMTVHDVKDTVLKIFDKIFLIGEGICIYDKNPNKELEDFLKKFNIKIPQDYSLAEFLIEILYSKNDLIDELKVIEKEINALKAYYRLKSKEILLKSKPEFRSHRNIFKWKFNKANYISLFKRFFKISIQSENFYMLLFFSTLITLLIGFPGYFISIANQPKFYNFYRNIDLNELRSFEPNMKQSIRAIFDMYNIDENVKNNIFKSLISFDLRNTLLYAVVCGGLFTSGILKIQHQLISEVHKGFYNSFTLFCAILSFEIFFRLIVTSVVLIIFFLVDSHRLFTFNDYFVVLLFSFIFPLTQSLVTALNLKASIFRKFATGMIENTLLYTTTIISKCHEFCNDFPVATSIIKFVTLVLTFSLNPAQFLTYILSHQHCFHLETLLKDRHSNFFQSAILTNPFNLNRESINKCFYNLIENRNDYAKAVAMLVCSLVFICFFASVIFSYYFTPKLSLKKSEKGQNFMNFIRNNGFKLWAVMFLITSVFVVFYFIGDRGKQNRKIIRYFQ